MYTELTRITHEDVNETAVRPGAEFERAPSGVENVATMLLPLVAFALGAWLAGSAQVGLALFAFTFAGSGFYSGAQRARSRKGYLIRLLQALQVSGEPDVALTRRFEKLAGHHRHLAIVELVSMPVVGLVMGLSQVLIVLVPAARAVGAGAITLCVIAIAALGMHIHRHHSRLRDEVRVSLAALLEAPTHE